MNNENKYVLEVENLTVHYVTEGETVEAVNDISFSLEHGKSLGIVGETGAGKTTTALAILRLIPNPPGRVVNGSVKINGKDMYTATKAELEFIRSKQREAYFADEPFEYEAIREEVEKMGLDDVTRGSLRFVVGGHGRKAPPMKQLYADLKQYASKLVYVHGKFYDIDENGQVDNMDYPAILGALKEGGYKGYIASEFEGNRRMNMAGWCDEIELVRKHHVLMRKCLGR